MSSVADIEIRLLVEAIHLRYGHDFRDYAPASLKRRVLQAQQRMGLPSISALQERVLHDRDGLALLLQVLTVPVSEMFRDPAYFLALVHVGVLAFAAMVVAAIALRRRMGWHRRLMLGSTVLIMEPALGRLLPMPLMSWWGEWVAMGVQLAALGWLVSHDRRSRGRVHSATWVAAAAVVGAHIAVELLAIFPPVQAIAAGIVAA